MLELLLIGKLAKLFEILLGFAGEADDESTRQFSTDQLTFLIGV